MTKYVAGFAFDNMKNRVALIRKNKPCWQAGKFNGIGGKIEEGETRLAAMIREFKEETGLKTDTHDWRHFAHIEGQNDTDGANFRVDFFTSNTVPIDMMGSPTEESTHIVDLKEVYIGRHDMIDNLPWIIAMARDHLDDGRPQYATVTYGKWHGK